MHHVYPGNAIVQPIFCNLNSSWLLELAADLTRKTKIPLEVTDDTLVIPEALGQGGIRHFMLEDGISAIHMEFTPAMPLVLQRVGTNEVEYYSIGFDTSPEGNEYVMDGTVNRLDYMRKYSAYYRTSNTPMDLIMQAGRLTRLFIILISESRIASLFPADMRPELPGKQEMLQGFFQINEELREDIIRIAGNLHHTSADYFLLKGTVNKLLAYALSVIAGQRQPRRKPEVEKMVELMDRLTADFTATPPMLREASRIVGVSPSKFKTIFRRIFKTSYHQYLVQRKMEKAKELLRQEAASITEVAYSLGYSSCSHFTRLFRKNFHISPQEYKQSARSANA
ncbi:helix-turn-helix domain-containing protein [Chitinophaga lutea]